MSLRRIIPYLFGVFVLVYFFQTFSFFYRFPSTWMAWATVLLVAALSPFAYIFWTNRDAPVNQQFDLHEEEKHAQKEPDEEQTFELKEIWLGHS